MKISLFGCVWYFLSISGLAYLAYLGIPAFREKLVVVDSSGWLEDKAVLIWGYLIVTILVLTFYALVDAYVQIPPKFKKLVDENSGKVASSEKTHEG